ncbi:protein prenylyltransferase [Wallemia mellicola CBS 633.66]|uniref:Protein farnesyltransferase/geranylgeranyltransferase type-1 subunit alpha n=1 Tax=Wallemia mellicola (strain ATCC MYA-4683 / CBS 633.66) TaxID=671144 RepID=I4YFF4_WALMC|nr:protein prenylyltransferase [Wallemia mellicola CBS 633.66]EIM22696.1 protein prenylyltransferase [Wallemia mellicola CBS 633.66]|eukprot:XP_006957359.1 protein prenylyltransferase [Wallemia mellicola CBS 633.66]
MLYAERDDFKDLTPIEQDEGPSPLAPINYSQKYKDAMDMFRAVVNANEKSERALGLTEDIIRMNAGHYTVWHYRTSIIVELGLDLQAELKLMDELSTEYLKSYQVWHHRRLCVESSRDLAVSELKFVAELFYATDDPKNYHTWVYRQWILTYFDKILHDDDRRHEFEFIESLITDDIYNNSVWSHRFFCLFKLGWLETTLDNEIDYVLSLISKAPSNMSSWNYLRGILKVNDQGLNNQRIMQFSETLINAKSASDDMRPPLPALEWLADAALEDKNPIATKRYLELKALDPIRKNYWSWKSHLALSA